MNVLADAVLVLHAAFVAFVVFGLVFIFYGHWRAWPCVRNPWFRTAHLVSIIIVAVQSWLGLSCPLTTLELALRGPEEATHGLQNHGFIAYWLHRLIFYNAPGWVFQTAYSSFAMAVIYSWFAVRPRRFGKLNSSDA